jgi:hypothetical protein
MSFKQPDRSRTPFRGARAPASLALELDRAQAHLLSLSRPDGRLVAARGRAKRAPGRFGRRRSRTSGETGHCTGGGGCKADARRQ